VGGFWFVKEDEKGKGRRKKKWYLISSQKTSPIGRTKTDPLAKGQKLGGEEG